jgi:site-specific recombinase XerD
MSIQTYTDASGNVRHRAALEVGKKLDGTPDRRSKVCDTEKEAKRVEREYYILRDKLAGRSDKDTLGVYVSEHYLPAKRKELRGLTIRGYESVINNHILPTLSEYKMGDINRAVVQSLITSRSTNKVAKNTRDVLRQILGHACDNEVLRSNPATGKFNFPAKSETDHDNSGAVITDLTEHYRIIQIARDNKEPILPVLVLGFCFGLRKEEVLGVDCSHVDLKNREIRVCQSYLHINGNDKIDPLKNEHSYRTLPMSTRAYKYLNPLRKDRIGPVCVHNNQRMTQHQAQKEMKRFVRKYDLPEITCHSLRHCFATAALKAGIPVELVSKMLGHKSIVTTYNRYVKPTLNDIKQVAAMLDKASGV